MKFSEKFEYKPKRTAIQIDSMDDPLRNAIWNLLGTTFPVLMYGTTWHQLAVIWYQYVIDGAIDSVPDYSDKNLKIHMKGLFLPSKFYEVYDYVGFIIANYDALFKEYFRRSDEALPPLDDIISDLNLILETNLSG